MVKTYLFPTRKNVDGYQREWYNNTEEILFEGVLLQGSIYRIVVLLPWQHAGGQGGWGAICGPVL